MNGNFLKNKIDSGKKIVGTAEAFSGYEDIIEKAGWLCRTANDFITSIAEAEQVITLSLDLDLREIYRKKYSIEAARNRIKKIAENSN